MLLSIEFDSMFQYLFLGVMTKRMTHKKAKAMEKVNVTYMFIRDPVPMSLLAARGYLFWLLSL